MTRCFKASKRGSTPTLEKRIILQIEICNKIVNNNNNNNNNNDKNYTYINININNECAYSKSVKFTSDFIVNSFLKLLTTKSML